MSEPWVRSGVMRIGLAGCMEGIIGDDGKVTRPECGFVHGPFGAVKADVLRLLVDLDGLIARQAAFEGTLQAHEAIARGQQQAAMVRSALNGKGLRIARP